MRKVCVVCLCVLACVALALHHGAAVGKNGRALDHHQAGLLRAVSCRVRGLPHQSVHATVAVSVARAEQRYAACTHKHTQSHPSKTGKNEKQNILGS